MEAGKALLLLLLLEGLAFAPGQDPCKDAKMKGYRVNCLPWNDRNCGDTCEWYEIESCDGECGSGISKETRSRLCKFFDDEKNKDLQCLDAQDKRVKCKMECGANGKYNEFLDFCECKENFGGACCNQVIQACTSPVVKEGETDRSIHNTGKGNRCDARLRPTWYRFNSPAGNLMPTECVPYGHCNTAVPFWLNGTHPRPQDGVVERNACGTQGEDCCKHKLKIKVRNCGGHMAYYLVPTQGCMKAYCVGSHEECPEGESSDTGFQPGCTDQFPDIKITPVVGYFVDEKVQNTVSLTCSGVYPDADKYLWKTQWFFDGEPGPIQEQKVADRNTQPKFYLPSTAWKGKMGTKCQCTMQGKLRTGGTWSRIHARSEEYYLGIIIEEKVVTVKEGEIAHITLRPTIPVRCSKDQEARDDCRLWLSLSLDPTESGPKCPGKQAEISQVIFHGDIETSCGYNEISFKNWHIASKLKIQPKLDIQLDGSQMRTLRLRVQEKQTSIPDIWKGYILAIVKINILDTDDRGTCKMVNDPHITTFDNRLYDFHDRPNQQGNKQIFVAYRHTKESEEVQARFQLCGGNIYCICGVAMRAGSSTVVFDKCRTGRTLHPDINYNIPNAKFDPRMRVFKHNSGTLYHVFLPTGTQVKVYDAGPHIWFEIKASVEIKGKVVGLCGNYNGDPKDDVRNSANQVVCPNLATWFRCEDESFRKSWHIVEAQSIFAGKVPPHQPDEQMDELYCDCVSKPGIHGYEDCDYHKRYEPCDEGYEILKPKKGYAQLEFPWLLNYKSPQHQNPNYAKAARSAEDNYYSNWDATTWSETTAKEFCTKELFSSQAVTACLDEVPNQDYSTNIEACALDLLLTGSTEFAATHLEAVKSECNQELRMNVALWEPRDDDASAGPPLRLMENLCPNECSGNGACIDGKCFCKKGFGSYDCALKVDEIPIVNGVGSSPVPCDRSKQECGVIALDGMKYLEGPELTCHYYKDDGDKNKFIYSGPSAAPAVSTLPATMFSLWIVQCQVPEQLSAPLSAKTTQYQFQVSVSNDGQKQSDRIYYGSYDARCEDCVNKTCTRKEDSCIISSKCYRYSEVNPEKADEVCNPSVDAFGWSPVASLTTPTTPATTTVSDEVVCNLKPGEVKIFRDPKNCSKYFVCEGDLRYHMSCPVGLVYSEKLGTCVDLAEVDVPGCS